MWEWISLYLSSSHKLMLEMNLRGSELGALLRSVGPSLHFPCYSTLFSSCPKCCEPSKPIACRPNSLVFIFERFVSTSAYAGDASCKIEAISSRISVYQYSATNLQGFPSYGLLSMPFRFLIHQDQLDLFAQTVTVA